jgi:hypothetical protein
MTLWKGTRFRPGETYNAGSARTWAISARLIGMGKRVTSTTKDAYKTNHRMRKARQPGTRFHRQ